MELSRKKSPRMDIDKIRKEFAVFRLKLLGRAIRLPIQTEVLKYHPEGGCNQFPVCRRIFLGKSA